MNALHKYKHCREWFCLGVSRWRKICRGLQSQTEFLGFKDRNLKGMEFLLTRKFQTLVEFLYIFTLWEAASASFKSFHELWRHFFWTNAIAFSKCEWFKKISSLIIHVISFGVRRLIESCSSLKLFQALSRVFAPVKRREISLYPLSMTRILFCLETWFQLKPINFLFDTAAVSSTWIMIKQVNIN